MDSDHKPLKSIFTKPLCSVPLRLQRMLLRLQKYDLKVKYVSGKLLHVADTLHVSRAYATNYSHSSTHDHDIELTVHQFVLHIPIAKKNYEQLPPRIECCNNLCTSLTLDGLTTSPMFPKMSASTGMYVMKFMLLKICCSWDTD